MSWRDRRRPSGEWVRGSGVGHVPALGPAVTRMLREAHAPPDDAGYWVLLEARVMAGVRQQAAVRTGPRTGPAIRSRPSLGWSAAFGAWSRAGLAAAGVAVVAAGVAAWSAQNTETRIAYETVVDASAPVPLLGDTRVINVSEREATVRYVFSN